MINELQTHRTRAATLRSSCEERNPFLVGHCLERGKRIVWCGRQHLCCHRPSPDSLLKILQDCSSFCARWPDASCSEVATKTEAASVAISKQATGLRPRSRMVWATSWRRSATATHYARLQRAAGSCRCFGYGAHIPRGTAARARFPSLRRKSHRHRPAPRPGCESWIARKNRLTW
jgi:hypothetical protein